ncbi:PREDICTED: uncharacterized protein LOC109127940 [Camelina sativa]|uniref:Uncharacterized protein LOC109127940 n=1 Tax=Camelina sativa TaxID=90675 RepID=A0ABM1QQR1_CAMSA|nr:PREDICTED: uncharacterized protein LOC109127940 [Camelina sativa]
MENKDAYGDKEQQTYQCSSSSDDGDSVDSEGKNGVEDVPAHVINGYQILDILDEIVKGRGPNMFQIQGENYHLLGSLKPTDGDFPKFSQLYIVDTENEVENRAGILSKAKNSGKYKKKQKLRHEVIAAIIKMLDAVNPYVENFRSAKERLDTNPEESFHMRIVSDRQKDGQNYDVLTSSEVTALIPGDFHIAMPTRDIVIEESGELQRISEIHSAYLALQYPLLFPKGDDGYRP